MKKLLQRLFTPLAALLALGSAGAATAKTPMGKPALWAIADADTIFVLQDGKLHESGTHAQLLKRDGLYADMWLRQLAEDDELEEAAE